MMRLRRAVLSVSLLSMLLAVPVPPALPDAAPDGHASEDPGDARKILTDKALHGIAGASAALLAGAIASACTYPMEPGPAAGITAAAAVGSAALVGLGKELLDLAGHGDPEVADLLCTLAGGAAAAALTYAFVLNQAPQADPWGRGVPLASFGLVFALPVADAWCASLRRDERNRGAGNAAHTVVP